MAHAGLPADGLLAAGDFSYASGEAAARQLLERPDRPSAIIASNDQMALATLEVARSLGIAVPQELSLISFDNTPLVHFTQPPLTAVDQPIAATTSKAVELIIAAQKGEAPPAALTVPDTDKLWGTAPPPAWLIKPVTGPPVCEDFIRTCSAIADSDPPSGDRLRLGT